ncbi:hypothetical protein H1R20_g4479, partial [Candolleomyces eurysporus]
MHSAPFPSTGHQAAAPLNLIHSDVSGPMSVLTPEGYRYWVTFIDDHTCFQVVMLLKRKSGVFAAFKSFKALAENQLGRLIKALHDDKGGEYMSDKFNTFCDLNGIVRHHTIRNCSQQNGDTEQANRTMNNDITAMLAQSKSPMHFWGCCLATQVKVWNCQPTWSLPGKTPYEAWYGQKPDLSCFQVFGCQAYVFVQPDKRKKLESHMQKCVFVGYPAEYKAWLFFNTEMRKFIVSERAEFDEQMFPGLSSFASPFHLPSSPLPPPLIPSFPIPNPDADIASSSIRPLALPQAWLAPTTPLPAAPAQLSDPPPSPPPPAAPAPPATLLLEGFHEGGPNKVCRLKKSLHGLKQAARQWNKKLHSVLTELGNCSHAENMFPIAST